MKKNYPVCLFGLAVLLIITTSPSSGGVPLSISGVGIYDLSGAPEGLSGITYAGGNQYYAVEDSGGILHPMTIGVDSANGSITGVSFGTAVTLNGRTDLEGVAYGGSDTVYVSDETGATITKYNVTGGSAISSVAVPDVFTAYRTNKSLESLTRQANGQSLWTANEEALSGTTTHGTAVNDGDISTSSYGTIVRLGKFNGNLNPAGQWAYKVDAHAGDPISGTPASGVSDLCVLPNGKLLVLEREIGGFIPSFRNRIYEVNFTGATNVSGDYTLYDLPTNEMVTKTLLWEGNFGLNNNFEGLCLGKKLDNGDYSLLMVSDGDGDPNESLYALRISGTIEPPTVHYTFRETSLGKWDVLVEVSGGDTSGLSAYEVWVDNVDSSMVSYEENVLGTVVGENYTPVGFQSSTLLEGDVGGSFNAGNYQGSGDAAIQGIGMVEVDEPGAIPDTTPHVELGVPALLGSLNTPRGLGEGDFRVTTAGLLNEQGDGFFDTSYLVPTLEVIPLDWLEGDANADGVVSAADYAAVQANFGNTGNPGLVVGDANGDGVVSAADYASVQANFGNTAAMQVIPEPATISLLVLGGVVIIRRRKQ